MSFVYLENQSVHPAVPTNAVDVLYYALDGRIYSRSQAVPGPVLMGGTNYFKARVSSTSSIPNFSSGAPVNVPDMTFVIPADGDYIIYGLVNGNNDQNEEADLYVAVNGTPQLDQVVRIRFQKNQDHSIQGTFDLDGLTAGQTVTLQLDTRNDNFDLLERRMIFQSWNAS